MLTRNHCCFLALLLLLFGCIQESWQLIIKRINIPATVKFNDTDYIILDCDYDLENTSSTGLVVKWFFNTNQVVYQWIYGRYPLADEPAAKYVDLTYKASNDPYTEYRAIKLNKPGVDLTGVYTCVISTYTDERTANASMIVYSTEEKFELVYRKKVMNNKDGVEIMCIAEGLYPQPTLNISLGNIPERQTDNPTIKLRDDGLYNILLRVTLLDEDLPETTIVKCLLSISTALYNVSRRTVYYAGTFTTTSTTTTKLHRKMEIQTLGKSNNDDGSSAGYVSINLPLLSMQFAVLSIFHQ
ncbi:uncharacterized protein [Mycetomoellerius zeteki]|uniref:uncharacterized protein n=1 Tax=Mycetomoellerius zeteki TaxID=64791 RepID=UPI00084E61B3|nr:PREDICTED: uncharacterized protein LOC108729137 [Trachymyrmex zeteki]XP_018313623.1 PREDICTED: uncharacterized protein LOC108729137 [Trachymyrmex zeteki]